MRPAASPSGTSRSPTCPKASRFRSCPSPGTEWCSKETPVETVFALPVLSPHVQRNRWTPGLWPFADCFPIAALRAETWKTSPRRILRPAGHVDHVQPRCGQRCPLGFDRQCRSGFPAGSPPGRQPHTTSVLTLDAKTGKLLAYVQPVKKDFHDWDMTSSPPGFDSHPRGRDDRRRRRKGWTALRNRPLMSVPPKLRLAVEILYSTPVTTRSNVNVPLSTTERNAFLSRSSATPSEWPGVQRAAQSGIRQRHGLVRLGKSRGGRFRRRQAGRRMVWIRRSRTRLWPHRFERNVGRLDDGGRCGYRTRAVEVQVPYAAGGRSHADCRRFGFHR